jgi:hypothetical protein
LKASLLGITARMKSNIKEGLSVFLGLICSSLFLDLIKLDYNIFRDDFVFWKALVTYGTQILFLLLWHWIFKTVSKESAQVMIL